MSDFEVFSEMASKEMDIACYPTLVEAKRTKKGGLITMGTHERCINEAASIMMGSQSHYFVLYVVNKEQFDAIKAKGLKATE